MLTIIIPTLNSGAQLESVLTALVPGVLAGLVRQLVIADGGSSDTTLAIADGAGADLVSEVKSRGAQLAAGARVAKGDWLLFLHADTVLEPGWEEEVRRFVDGDNSTISGQRAAAFRFRLNDHSITARWLERVVALRCRWFALPYGDQGLLISRDFYASLGGFSEIPLMEDVDMVRRIGAKRLHMFHHSALTDAERYKSEGYFTRMARNATCLTMWFAGVKPERIVSFYK
jgi:rSAM/selenodomain-associated transferase 2